MATEGGDDPSREQPKAGEPGRNLAEEVATRLIGDPGGETVAYGAQQPPADRDRFPAADDLIGRTLGQYRMGPILGQGSMGRVYRAEHEGLVRPCAIKVMNPGLLIRQPQILDQFWAEARAIAALVHPHIVMVHNLGSDRGYHYIEMEYMPGGISLKQVLAREGAATPVRATTWVLQVVQALGAAHQSGLIHRDVKPANVLLAANGRAKLADFGLVRRLRDAELPDVRVAGTPSFMAPELFAGASADPRSEVYAVGVMYYYLLTAQLPFSSDRLSRLIQFHCEGQVPDVHLLAPETPDEVAAILARCLAKSAADRYDSAEELAEDLRSALFGMSDPEALVRESLEGLNGVVQGGPDHFRILLQLPGGRLQEVHIEITPGRLSKRLLSVYSVCCPAEADHLEFALKLNAEMTYGGLSIRRVDGRPMFVMARTYPDGHAGADQIRAAIREIARRSDWVEEQLTRADNF